MRGRCFGNPGVFCLLESFVFGDPAVAGVAAGIEKRFDLLAVGDLGCRRALQSG